jgi:large subunit ribosomal protein L31
MKKEIHPTYELANVACACGNAFQTSTTVGDMKVEVCSACHPFYTGKAKKASVDGRTERFYRKYKNYPKDEKA